MVLSTRHRGVSMHHLLAGVVHVGGVLCFLLLVGHLLLEEVIVVSFEFVVHIFPRLNTVIKYLLLVVGDSHQVRGPVHLVLGVLSLDPALLSLLCHGLVVIIVFFASTDLISELGVLLGQLDLFLKFLLINNLYLE